MANPAVGLALGGAAKSFRAADERAVQREGIQAQRDIASGVQTGQNERAQLKVDEARRKAFVEDTKVAFGGLRDKVSDLTASITSETTPVEAAEIVRERDMTLKGMEQMLSGVAPTRKINGGNRQNPFYSPSVFSALSQQLADAKRAFNLAGRKAQADATRKGQNLLRTAESGGTEAAAGKAGDVKKAEEAAKTPAKTTGEKRVNLIRELSKELNRVNVELGKTPDDPVLQAEKRLLEDEFDQDTIGKVLVEIVRKVIEKGEGSLTPNEQAALNVMRNVGGLQLFLQNTFGGLGQGAPSVAPPAASTAPTLDFKKLSKPMQDLVNDAKEFLESKGEEAVKKVFLEQGGSEQVFNQFVLGR